ncbi:uncharacterized protein LOC130735257 [Lotus japonicus]|uniref:uncharacterized protein LOC130735257 n=1 Tax=Lotus japonicus TaxID=34305 RepID=UPI00258A2516|nr:uncharacterized protein LOC130735257 [Lotus japonicus]
MSSEGSNSYEVPNGARTDSNLSPITHESANNLNWRSPQIQQANYQGMNTSAGLSHYYRGGVSPNQDFTNSQQMIMTTRGHELATSFNCLGSKNHFYPRTAHYTVYDSRYKALGLYVDPHLRAFMNFKKNGYHGINHVPNSN